LKRIAIVAEGGILPYSPSMQNLIDYLSKENKIDYFNKVMLDNSFLYNHNIENKYIIDNKIKSKIYEILKGFIYISKIRKNIFLIFRVLKAIITETRQFLIKYDAIIVFDQTALQYLKILKLRGKLYLYSLELYLKKDGVIDPIILNFDYNKLSGIIIQSRERANELINEFNIKTKVKTLIVPVCTRMSENFSNQFNISKLINDDQITLLYTGWFEIDFILKLIENIKSNMGVKLVLHLSLGKDKNRLTTIQDFIINNNIQNVVINSTFFKEMSDLNKYISESIDIGIAWYPSVTTNLTLTGFSSGKIAAYFEQAKPVIVNDSNSLKEMVEKSNAGICISEFSQINEAIEIIKNNYHEFSKNAREQFKVKYNFNIYLSEFNNFLKLV